MKRPKAPRSRASYSKKTVTVTLERADPYGNVRVKHGEAILEEASSEPALDAARALYNRGFKDDVLLITRNTFTAGHDWRTATHNGSGGRQ